MSVLDQQTGPLSHKEFEFAAQRMMSEAHGDHAGTAISLTVSLARAVARLERDLDQTVSQPFGLSLSTYRVLFSLHAVGPLRPGDLSGITTLAPGSVTSILKRLEDDGLVTRRRNDVNRRESIVTLTDAGHALTATVMKASSARQEKWLEALTWGETIELIRLLHRLIDHHPDFETGDFGENTTHDH